MRFPSYERYKKSNVEWLGDVPEKWSLIRLRFLFEIKKRIVGELGPNILSITQQGIKVKDLESNEGQLSLDYSKYQVVEPDDFAMNHMDLLTGFIDISPRFGVTSPDYRVFSVREQASIVPRFFLYIFQNAYRQKVFYAYGQGSSHFGRWRLPTEAFQDFQVPTPPLAEQEAIAAFLDQETAKIDALIEEQRQLIELLKEKRQAVVSHAVTKGMNPAAPMKDSGIDWIGQIPSGWQIKKIKAVSKMFGRIGYRGYTTADLVDEGKGAISLSPSNMIDGVISTDRVTYISWDKYEESPEIKIAPDDIAMVKTGSTLGKVAYVREVKHPMTINPQIVLVKEILCLPRYLFFVLNSAWMKAFIEVNNSGSSIPTITQEDIGNAPITVPPPDEQLRIAMYLDNFISIFDEMAAEANQSINLLQERRSALISAAVTGKIDVRNYSRRETPAQEEVYEPA